MTDKLTTEERVKLAEFCGKKHIQVAVSGRVFHGPEGECRYPIWEWNPAEDANQRDELVEALRKDEWRVATTIWPDGKCRTELVSDYRQQLVHSPMSDTPGDAVTRAALKVIAETEKANAD